MGTNASIIKAHEDIHELYSIEINELKDTITDLTIEIGNLQYNQRLLLGEIKKINKQNPSTEGALPPPNYDSAEGA